MVVAEVHLGVISPIVGGKLVIGNQELDSSLARIRLADQPPIQGHCDLFLVVESQLRGIDYEQSGVISVVTPKRNSE
jgi:hypothetical protein